MRTSGARGLCPPLAHPSPHLILCRSPGNVSSCEPCPANTYTPDPSSSECKPCPSGATSDKVCTHAQFGTVRNECKGQKLSIFLFLFPGAPLWRWSRVERCDPASPLC